MFIRQHRLLVNMFLLLATATAAAAVPFKHAREIFVNTSYPPVSISYIDFPPNQARIDTPMVTRHWKLLEPDYTRFDLYNKEPAIIKAFEQVIVYRSHDTTYVHGPTVWTASERCYQGETPAVLPPSDAKFSIHEALLVSSQIWGEGYFHYMTEKGFMIAGARTLLESNPGMVILVEDAPNQLLDFFDLFGMKSRVLVLKTPIKVHRLYMPYYSQCGYTSPSNLLLTRKWIRDRHPLPPIEPLVLVLDRKEHGKCNRCIEETADLIKELSVTYPDHRVERYVAGEMSLKEQMDKLGRAQVLIAPHGAGLTNMIFMQPTALVIELATHPYYFNYCYYDMAAALGLKYLATLLK